LKIETGWNIVAHRVRASVEDLDRDKLTPLLRLNYRDSMADAIADLGKSEEIGQVFVSFQKYLYQPETAGLNV
jgi:type I restriction enzyme R subunit